MDLSKLLRKPKISYTPERVELPEPEEQPELIEPSVANYESHADYVADVRSMVAEELEHLESTIQAVVEAVGDIEVDVLEDYLDAIGKPKVTMSDYLESLSSEEYGPLAILGVFEEHVMLGDPAPLAISLLDDMKRELQLDMELLSDDIFAGNFDPTGAKDSALYAIRSAVADSVELRKEISKATHLAGKAIDVAVWAHVLEAEKVIRFKHDAEVLIRQLKQVQGLLKMGTTIYSLDWKSVSSSLRDRLRGALMDQMMRRMFSAYNRAYNKVVMPLEPVLHFLGDRRAEDIEEVQHLRDLLARPIDDVRSKASETTADIYALQRKRTEIRVKGARTVGAMSYTWRLISQLDMVIAALAGLSGTGAIIEAEPPRGALGKLLGDPRVHQLSPTDQAEIRIEGSPVYDQVLASLPANTGFTPK